MLKNQDRSGYWGASETSKIVGNWNTKSFMDLYLIKLGIIENNFKNIYLMAGNAYERKIAQSLGLPMKFDRCIRIPKLRLRVNLDAETKDCIFEIKTHKATDKKWQMPIGYWQQCQVQMYATGKHKCKLVAYPMTNENYENFFLDIDKEKVEIFDIEYDEEWVKKEYLPRLVYLAECLKKRKTPNIKEFRERSENV